MGASTFAPTPLPAQPGGPRGGKDRERRASEPVLRSAPYSTTGCPPAYDGKTDMSRLYFEDFTAGQTFSSGTLRVTTEDIKTFAAQFDPQPFHLDEAAAASTFFKGLAASGWHTAALT